MSKKIVITISILGESIVGKTCLCSVYLGNEFESGNLSTIGIDKLYKEITMSDGKKATIKLWDTAGQERFRSTALNIIRSSKGVIVVFDITVKKSFDKVGYWLEEIRKASQDMPVVLFGNKCDLEEKRQVTYDEAKKYADNNNFLYFETSAKNNINVNEGFGALCEIVYKKMGESKGFKIGDNKKQKKKKGGC